MYEKRVYIRFPAGIEGSYQPVTRLAAPRLGMTRDISLGGARFASVERLEPGGKISLTLSLPKEGEVVLTGTVVWSRMTGQGRGQTGYESGLCWQNVDARAQARLNSFFTEYARPEQPAIITSGPASAPMSWTRIIAFGLGIAAIIGLAAIAGLSMGYHF